MEKKIEGLSEYKFKRHRGIDDLEGYLGDGATDWWTEKDWAEWNADEEGRKKRNEEYIARLKEEGRYGEEYEISIVYKPLPQFQDKGFEPKFEMRIINLGDENYKFTPDNKFNIDE